MSPLQLSRDGHGRLASPLVVPSGSGPQTDPGPTSTHGGPSTTTATRPPAPPAHTGFTHASHTNCPDSLSCLADTNDKPNHILPVIVRAAILGSPPRKLTLRGIYAAIEEKWPYFRTAPPGWKDSIRHNLSLNRLFKKIPRPGTEAGHGSYWTVDLHAPPGSKRPRKRRTPGQLPSSSSRRNYATSGDVGAVIMPPFRLADAAEEEKEDAAHAANPVATAAAASRESRSETEPDDGGPEYAPSDYESEEPALASDAAGGGGESDKARASRLEAQLGESQRQFAMASAFSLRVAQQLEEAREEARRAQAALARVREQLEEELVARVEVERRLEVEEGRRREAEGRVREMVSAEAGGQTRWVEAMRSIRDISSKTLDLGS